MKKLIALIKYWLKLVPKWKDCKYASCWDGNNAERRMMNILSPHFPEQKFKEYVSWMEGRDCDTAHVFFMNGHDGEGAGYTALDNVKLSKERIKYLRLHGFAVVPWIIADDSGAYAKALFANPETYVKGFAKAGLFDHASYIVLGLEMDEYGNATQWGNLLTAVKKYVPDLKIGVHHTSNKFTFAAYGDIVLDQLDPKSANVNTITNNIKKILGMGKQAVGFEYSRHADRNLAQAALNAGAFGCGNW